MAGSYRKECGLLKNHYADEYEELLKTWADRLLELQVHDTGNKRLDGGILCPACMTIHGRCTDFIYPLLYLEDRYGGGSYQKAALRLFDWGENLLCDDGSMYNDAQSPWNGITVFSVISLCEALENHGHLLKEADRKRFEERLDRMGGWIYQNLTMEFVTNINYHAATAAAMALLGSYRGREDYKARARQVAKGLPFPYHRGRLPLWGRKAHGARHKERLPSGRYRLQCGGVHTGASHVCQGDGG